jgi:hypothetical protein
MVLCSLLMTVYYLLLQLCSGVDESAPGACAQLVFAPIDESFSDDAPLLPSGFRVIPLDGKAVSISVLNGFVTGAVYCQCHISYSLYAQTAGCDIGRTHPGPCICLRGGIRWSFARLKRHAWHGQREISADHCLPVLI